MATKTGELNRTLRRLEREYRARWGHAWRYQDADVVYVKGYFQIVKCGETLVTNRSCDVIHNHLVRYASTGERNMAMLRAGVRK